MELSIDSSTRYASVGISDRGVVVGAKTWLAERNHSVELVPAITELMANLDIGARDLRAVFVARGPGGFSSLRVGVAFAKTIAMGLNVPVVGVGTLEIELAPHLPSVPPVCAIIRAGGGRLYAAWANGDTDQVAVYTPQSLADRIDRYTTFCGEAVHETAPILAPILGELAGFIDSEPPTRTAETLAHLGWERLQAGGEHIPDRLEPLYMKSAQYSVAARTHLG